MNEIGPIFLAGLIIVLLGAVTVLVAKPRVPADAPPAAVADDTQLQEPRTRTESARELILRIASIALVVCCWGSYGPVLHIGQAAMHHSRLRPLVCVGLAYFAIAVVVPNLWLSVAEEASRYNFSGSMWSLAAGAAGALGALGIIMSFNFGGKPVYVMPLVFGGAPVVNTVFTTSTGGLWGEVSPLFFAGLILVIAGSAMVLVFAPRGDKPPKPAIVPKPEEKTAPEPTTTDR